MTRSVVELVERVDELETQADRDLRSGGTTSDSLSAILDRADELLHQQPQRAERLARWCDARSEGPGLLGLRARSRYQQAQIAAERGELDAALDLIAEARALWAEAEDPVASLRTDLGRMHVLDDLGRHHAAIEVGERLIEELDQFRADGHDDDRLLLIRAHAVKNLGVAYGLVGCHTEALAAYERAETDYLALGMPEETALPLANRGVELLALGQPAAALADFDRAIAIFTASDDRVFAAQCQGDAAQAHRQLGQVGEALALLEQARQTLDGLEIATEAARLRLALAETYLAVGLWLEARDAAEAAATATATAGLTHDEAMAHFLVALAELALDRCAEAVEELDTAAALFAQVEDRQYLARVRLATAEAAARLGQVAIAEQELEACATELLAGGWAVPLVWARLWQADLAADPATIAARLADLRGLVMSLGLPELSYEYELRVGRMHRHQGRPDDAEAHLRRAVDQLAHAAGAIPDHALLTAFRADRSRAHTELTSLLLERGRPEDLAEAALVADDIRAQTLTDLLTQAAGRGPVLSTAGRDLGEAFAELSALYLEEQRAGNEDGDRLELLAERTEVLERRVNTLRLRHLDAASEHAKTMPGPLSRSRSASVLSPTVAFHVGTNDELLVFVHLDETTIVRRLPEPLSRVHDLMDELDDQWSRIAITLGLDLGHSAALLRTTRHTLRALYAALLEPVAELLTDRGDRVCIVPDGRMGAVPFSALFDGERHVIERWAITVAPTLVPAGRPDLTVDVEGSATVVAVADEYAPAMDEEARLVVGLLPRSDLLAGDAATVAEFTRSVTGKHLVHVACHGVYRPDNPLFSRLRLTDRWMTSAEIVQLDLRGALVVLSACESGSHGRTAEPVGLGWAFLAAGAAGVLVSHWPVDDAATATLMSALYEHLSAGEPPDSALRLAQLHAAEFQPHPFYWGAFSYLVNPIAAPAEASS